LTATDSVRAYDIFLNIIGEQFAPSFGAYGGPGGTSRVAMMLNHLKSENDADLET
jgi:hypothetical protein